MHVAQGSAARSSSSSAATSQTLELEHPGVSYVCMWPCSAAGEAHVQVKWGEGRLSAPACSTCSASTLMNATLTFDL